VTARTQHTAGGSDAGFTALELVVITPVLVVMLLLVVGFGRLTHGRQLVDQAAAAAARAATLDANPVQAERDARAEAAATLTQAGVSCAAFTTSVDTSQFYPGGQVTVTVRCITRLSSLGLAGFPGAKTFTATASSTLEQFRQLDASSTR